MCLERTEPRVKYCHSDLSISFSLEGLTSGLRYMQLQLNHMVTDPSIPALIVALSGGALSPFMSFPQQGYSSRSLKPQDVCW